MIALEEQRQAQTERLLADVRPRPVPLERQAPLALERQAPLVNYQESSFGPFPSSVQASQAPDFFRELGMRQYLATFPQMPISQVLRGGPEPAASGQPVHYHVHFPSCAAAF